MIPAATMKSAGDAMYKVSVIAWVSEIAFVMFGASHALAFFAIFFLQIARDPFV